MPLSRLIVVEFTLQTCSLKHMKMLFELAFSQNGACSICLVIVLADDVIGGRPDEQNDTEDVEYSTTILL